MKRSIKSCLGLCLTLILSLTACGNITTVKETTGAEKAAENTPGTEASATAPAAEQGIGTSTSAGPKYVFLFIGDGMSYPQFQLTSDYLGALADTDESKALPSTEYASRGGAVLDGPTGLNFMEFPVAGTAVNYDSSSFAPDSASSATSMATGNKTYANMINVDESGSVSYETIAEKLHDQNGWKIGLVSTVNLNHATPAAFYAHQSSRKSYHEIGVEMMNSGFEYFAGGGLRKADGNPGLYQLAEEAGYKVTYTKKDAEAVTAADNKVILIDDDLADSDSMSYALDRESGSLTLADYVAKGIEVLDNDTGFFMMCESGKIDWACHSNDAASAVNEVMVLADAVQVAVEFAEEHPEETLILVTGDHETGGLTIGYAETEYDTYLDLLANQKISFAKFKEQYVAKYKKNDTSFKKAMKDVESLFGLKMNGKKSDRMVLTDYEIDRLSSAYKLSTGGYKAEKFTQKQQVLYGDCDPFTVTVTHILANKAGIDFTSYCHTGLPVAVFADGCGAESFGGYYDNTEIYNKLAMLTSIE